MEQTIDTADRPRALRRAHDGRMIAGVCAGLSDYFDVDVVLVRVVVAALAVVAGVGLPLYLAAWLLVPDDDTDESVAERLLGDARSQRGCSATTAGERPVGAPFHERRQGEDHHAEAS